MAITFDPINKIIQLDSLYASEKEIWTAMVDWSVLSDNLKYGVGMTQLGGFEPVALYIYLELGWTIRPMEANGITTISGNVLVQGGGSPIATTLGDWQILVNMETPVKATAIEVNTGSAVTAQDKTDIATAVWNSAVRVLTSAGLDETSLHTALDSYANKDSYKSDVSNLSADVNVVEVNGVAVTSVDDFKASSVNQTDIHTALDSYTNKADYKADVSNLSADVNVVEVGGVAVTSIDDFKTSSEMTEIELHSGLDSYANKSDYKNNITTIATAVWEHINRTLTSEVGLTTAQEDKVDEIITAIASLPLPDQMSELELHSGLDSYINKADWQTKVSADEIHTALNSYTNKDSWKADLPAVAADVNVVQLNGAAVTTDDFKTDISTLATSAELSSKPTGLTTDERIALLALSNFDDTDVLLAIDNVSGFTATDRTKLQSLSNYTDLHAHLDSYINKGDWMTSDKMLESELHAFLDSYLNKADWKSTDADFTTTNGKIDDVKTAVDNLPLPDQMTAAELHIALDAYLNKDDWKQTATTSLTTQQIQDAIFNKVLP